MNMKGLDRMMEKVSPQDSEKIEAETNASAAHPVFEHPDTLYAFLGEYEGRNINNYAWTSWKNIKDVFRFILPRKIQQIAFYNSFKDDITIVNTGDKPDKFILKSKAATIINSINYDARYDVVKPSGQIGKIKFCITSSEGALSVTTTDTSGNFEDNWNKILSDKAAWTEGIDVFSYEDAQTGRVCCTDVSRIRTFKGRGNATWRMDKKSFKIKFYEQKSCLGMEKTNSLCLLANYQDGALMRNKFVYDIANEAKLACTPDSRYLDLYVNGSYKGVYQLSEAHKLGKNKLVKITDLEDAIYKKARKVTNDPDFDVYAVYANKEHYKTEEYNGGFIRYFDIPEEYNPDNNTGGYLIEVNVKSHGGDLESAFITPRGQFVSVLSPEYCTEAQIKYICDYFTRVENSFYNNDEEYLSLIDIKSVAQTYLIQELSKNIDGGVTSTFFHKEKDSVMFAGPVWDYDCALGNLYGSRSDEYGRKYDTDKFSGWFSKKIAIADNGKQANLYTAACRIDRVWKTVRSVWEKDFMPAIDAALEKKAPEGSRLKSIKDYEKALLDAAHINYLIHPAPGAFYWIPCGELTFEGQIKYIINWLADRQKWLNDKILNTGADFFVFMKQTKDWTPAAYFWKDGESAEDTWPGGFMRDAGNSIYGIAVSGNADRIIFSNNGSGQTADLAIPGHDMVYDLDSGKWSRLQ